MRLRDVQIDDVDAYVQMRCDPVMMAHLGGPRRPEDMAQKVKRDAAEVAGGRALIYMIVVDGLRADQVAGTVTLWRHDADGVSEIGWMVLPAFQGRGLASRAVTAMQQARAEQRWGVVHAYPSIENTASNAICVSRPGSPSPALSTWHSRANSSEATTGGSIRRRTQLMQPPHPPGALRLLPALPLVGRA